MRSHLPTVPLLRAVPVYVLMFIWLGLVPAVLHAQRLGWKLEDFKPLTELPWDEEMKTPMEQVIFTIYHEPEYTVRRCFLDEYLRALPDAELGKALDLCLEFEGTQSPDDLVEYFIGVWAKRDPTACWERVKKLMDVVGIEHGWLMYDGWKRRPRITVRNREAIKASKFWLGPQALSGFGTAVEQSSLPREERTKLVREFADVWSAAFGEMPVSREGSISSAPPSFSLSTVFSGLAASRRGYISQGGYPCVAKIAVRRCIKSSPAEALEVIQQYCRAQKDLGKEPSEYSPSSSTLRAFYQVWAEADLAGMVRWADTLKVEKNDDWRERHGSLERVYVPKGILMGRVDAEKRQQWMDRAQKEGGLYALMERWAEYDPKASLDAAVKLRDEEILGEVLRNAAYGPDSWPCNISHPGMGVVRDYDFSSLPEELYRSVILEAGIVIMEQWGALDVGEAARFAMKHLERLGMVEQPEVLAYFRGENDDFADSGGLLDRAFCAMRVWAVTRPDEMKAWIATVKKGDLRTALIWLLENPWGSGPDE